MTVARIMDQQPGADFIEVVFHESAMFYVLSKMSATFASDLAILRDAFNRQRPVVIKVDSLGTDAILGVEATDMTEPQNTMLVMTVSKIMESASEFVEITFQESTLPYRLPKASPSFHSDLALIRDCFHRGRPVVIWTEEPDHGVIVRVEGTH